MGGVVSAESTDFTEIEAESSITPQFLYVSKHIPLIVKNNQKESTRCTGLPHRQPTKLPTQRDGLPHPHHHGRG